MARMSNKVPTIETKALAAESKSAGMRLLFEAGYKVSQVVKVFGVGYGFAYGVAQRGGFAEVAAERRAPRRIVAKQATKPATKATKTTKPVVTKVVAIKASSTKAATASKIAAKPGRPTAARRLANRKSTPVKASA